MAQQQRETSYRVTFVVLATAVAAFSLLQSLVVPVLATIQEDLHTDQSTATWVLTAYLLAASVATPIVGRVGDAVGKKKMMLVTLGLLAAGSLLAALATSVGVLIVARVIQGFGGGVLPLAFGMIRDEFPAAKVGAAVALMASLTAVGSGLGSVIAGPIVTSLGYHWLFWLPMIVTLLAGVATFAYVPESRILNPTKIRLLPAALLSAWLICLLFPLSKAPHWGWAAPRTLGLFAASIVLVVVWIWVEQRSDAPLIDMRMMRLPAVWTLNLVAFLVGIGMYASFGFVPQFVQTPTSEGYGFGATITESGLMLLPSALAVLTVGLLSGRVTRRFGDKRVIITGTILMTLSFALLTGAHDEKWQLYLANLILGLGIGASFSAMSSLIVEAVSVDQTGVASGMNANIRTIGGSVGAALMGTVVAAGAVAGGLPKESGYTHGFLMLTGLSALATLAALIIPVVRRAHLPDEEAEPAHAALGLVAAGTVVGDKPE